MKRTSDPNVRCFFYGGGFELFVVAPFFFRYRRPRQCYVGHPASTSPVRSPGPGGLHVLLVPLGIVQQFFDTRMAFLHIPRRGVDLAGM